MLERSNSQTARKKVLFLVTQSEFGGAQRFIHTLLTHLSRDLYNITVAVGSDGDGSFSKAVSDLGLPCYTVASLKRDIHAWRDLKTIVEIKRVLKVVQPDVLFLNSSKAGFIGALAARPFRRKMKVIYRIGGWTFNDPWPFLKRRLWIWLEKLSARWKDIIIVNNAFDLEQAKKLGIRPRERLELVHNGVDPYTTEFLTRDEARIKIFEIISRLWGKIFQVKKIVGTIANFYPTKNVKDFILAAADSEINDETVFVAIGDGQERPELEKLIKENGLERKVFLIGKIDDAARYLPAFDVFVLPSVKEGFPWALLEAMTAKLPVIATAVGAAPEIIENGKNGFMVEPGHPEQISERIKEILANDGLALELGIQAHQTVLFKFNVAGMVSKIETLL